MEWTRLQTVQLASNSCQSCYGLGLKNARFDSTNPCNCVLREAFRRCLSRYKRATEAEYGKYTRYNLIRSGELDRCFFNWGYKELEYCADFLNLVRRAGLFEKAMVKMYHLDGSDWRACCIKFRMDKGQFFHSVYRVEQKIGRLAAELRPYPLIDLSFVINERSDFRRVRFSKKGD